MAVDTVTGNTSSTTGTSNSGTTAAAGGGALSADSFLKILIAQMQSQDPLNPMDNAEMTSQLAQINMVQGIGTMNATLNSVLSQLGTVDQLNATSMIGHGVLVDGNTIDLSKDSDGNAVAGAAVDLGAAASNVQIQIKDSTGAVVRTMDLGAAPEGIQAFTWDGRTDSGSAAATGSYTFTATASDNATGVFATALTLGHVEGVQRSSSGAPMLDLGTLGLVDQSSIRQVF